MNELWRYLSTWSHWTGESGIGNRLANHLWLSLVAVVIAALLAVPAGVLVGRRGGRHVVAVAVANIGRAVPSFAILVLVLPLSIAWGFGLGFWPTAVAMVALALPPIFVNTLTGVAEVPAEVRDAAAGMGMRPWQVTTRVEWPLALPLVLTGVRIATLQVIATATLGAVVAFSGLGSLIEEGRASFDDGKTYSGTLLVITAALASQALLVMVERRLARWRSTA